MIDFLTEERLSDILPSNKDISFWVDMLHKHLPPAHIDTIDRVSLFIAQTSHESNQYNVIAENLNYSREGLLRTFRKYFNESSAASYARNPQKIANRVYANRMGNGPESSGDGWRFRGHGLIQVTGKNNHMAFANFLKISINECLDYIQTKEGALHSAVWYWNVNGLNKYGDSGDVHGSTRIINGGTIGLEEREREYRKILNILK